ncbi:MAG: TolC family protein [Kiritimatiellaeota bacterium]|nr:TolC family protein [Kiritimatiellota bacterium]
MKLARIQSAALFLLLGWSAAVSAEPEKKVFEIDLLTALRLAGAQNLDLKLAQEKLAEARADHESARQQFFPWIAPGVGYRRHDGNTQAVTGEILDVSKQSYTAGATLTAQLDLGDALYKTLAARQLVKAADQALAAQRQDAVLAAAQGYFDLAKAQAAVGVATEAVRISQDYEARATSSRCARRRSSSGPPPRGSRRCCISTRSWNSCRARPISCRSRSSRRTRRSMC